MAHVRSFGSVLFGILVVVILAGIGVGIYDAGLQQGIAQSATVPAGTVPYYAYGWHGGFGIFGLLFPILFLFLIFGFARAAFRGRRGWGGGWGHGYGYGPGYGAGKAGPGPWMGGQDRDQWVADWHRRLHESEGTEPKGSGPSSGTPPAS
jgi:hypothetical protein